MTFPEWLHKNMDENCVTNYKLARAIGVSVSTVANWKSGKFFPVSSQIMSLAKAFRVDPMEIVDMAPEDCAASRLSGVRKHIKREEKSGVVFTQDELSNILQLFNSSCRELKELAETAFSLSVALDEAIRKTVPVWTDRKRD